MNAVGSPLKRREDPKLLVGEGKYVDDIQVPGQLWMGMVRSPMAHAKIESIDTSAAEQAEGVHAVYTGPQLEEMGLWLRTAALCVAGHRRHGQPAALSPCDGRGPPCR